MHARAEPAGAGRSDRWGKHQVRAPVFGNIYLKSKLAPGKRLRLLLLPAPLC